MVGESGTPRIFYGWWIALSFFFMNFYWAGTMMVGMSALFNPIKDSFGLSATMFTSAIALRQALGIVAAPGVGYVFDRVGARPLIAFSMVAAVVGMLILGLAHSLWMFFVAFFISGIGMAVFTAGTGPAAMAVWFFRHRGKAISIVMAGAGTGTLVVPLIAWIEGEWGWRVTVFLITGGLVLISVPGVAVLRRTPEDHGLRPDGEEPLGAVRLSPESNAEEGLSQARSSVDFSFREAMRHPAFWLVTGGMAVAGMGMNAGILLTVPHLEDEGYSRTIASLLVPAVGMTGVVSSLGLGWLSDTMDRRWLLALSYAMQTAGLLVFAFFSETWHLVFFVIGFGVGARAIFPLVSSLQAEYFGRTHFGKIQGVLIATFMVGVTIGPVIGGSIRDLTGAYSPAFLVYALAPVISLIALSFVRRPQR